MVGAAPTAIYTSVREGSAAPLGPTGGKVVIPAGKAAELDTQTAQPSIAGDHPVRNIVIGSAITGGIAAAFIACYETHKSVQCTAAGSDCSCDHCVASAARRFLLGRSRWSLDGGLRWSATDARSAQGVSKLPRPAQ